MKRLFTTIFVVLAGIALFAIPSASAQTAGSGDVRLSGVVYSSVGVGDPTAGTAPYVTTLVRESVVLVNNGTDDKNLKGYTIIDKAGNLVKLCKTVVQTCAGDMNDWLTIPARTQLLVDVEALHANTAFVNNGGDTLRLRNSVGATVSTLAFAVS
jgi:hypothetical protein